MKAKYLGVVCCCKEARGKITSFCVEGLPKIDLVCGVAGNGGKAEAQREHF